MRSLGGDRTVREVSWPYLKYVLLRGRSETVRKVQEEETDKRRRDGGGREKRKERGEKKADRKR